MIERTQKTDAEIIRLTLAGNRQAFEDLLVRYTKMAYAIAYARLGNHEDVQDAVQEAWVQAFQRLDTLRERERFAAWFSVIVRNIGISAAKKRWREQPLDNVREMPMYDARKTIEEKDMQQALWSQIVELAPDHREVLTLHYYAGLTTEEIAQTTGDSREAVKKRLQRARVALNEQMLTRVFEPAEQEEERLRKRVMGILLFMPAPWPALKEHDAVRQTANALGRAPRKIFGIRLSIVGLMAVVCAVFLSSVLLRSCGTTEPAMTPSIPARPHPPNFGSVSQDSPSKEIVPSVKGIGKGGGKTKK